MYAMYAMHLKLPFFIRFPKIEEKLPLLFNAGEPGTMSLYIKITIYNSSYKQQLVFFLNLYMNITLIV